MSYMGRPKVTDEEYQRWLDEMRPFLMQGYSLNSAIERAGLNGHRTSMYEKYAQKDWFSDKIDYFQGLVGELANNIAYKVIANTHAKLIQNPNYVLSKEEVRIITLVATKHRSSQPFFVTRTEVAQTKHKDFGGINEVPQINYIVPNEA
ncbi:MAG: hypothetical protein HY044_02165 [Candidatus Woesebacteria bacterium]|nr:MAG: hypothetical protein HY044_02165 [Candidatus Woesebacteria bacterium]